MPDFDPQAVPVRPAATVMLVDDRPDLQVFMVERHAKTVFAGGMWVFPGGALDATDDPAGFPLTSQSMSDFEASRQMGLEAGGLAYCLAAIRETFEEAGVLLAVHQAGGAPLGFGGKGDRHSAEVFDRHREALNAGRADLRSILAKEQLLADPSQLHYVARWITPLGSPRRFDARFFVAAMPPRQAPLHDDREVVNSCWRSPADILARHKAGKMGMISPTSRMVASLSLFGSAQEVIHAASASLPDEQVRVDASTGELLLPGEPGYEAANPDIENGWIRLKPPA